MIFDYWNMRCRHYTRLLSFKLRTNKWWQPNCQFAWKQFLGLSMKEKILVGYSKQLHLHHIIFLRIYSALNLRMFVHISPSFTAGESASSWNPIIRQRLVLNNCTTDYWTSICSHPCGVAVGMAIACYLKYLFSYRQPFILKVPCFYKYI